MESDTLSEKPSFDDFAGRFSRSLHIVLLMEISKEIDRLHCYLNRTTFPQRYHFQIRLYYKAETFERACVKVRDVMKSLQAVCSMVQHMELQSEECYVFECTKDTFRCA